MQAGDVISYLDMCQAEGVNLQQGMNFQLRGGRSVILMSVRTGAPYADQVENGGRVLIYDGHDQPRTRKTPNPKLIDQVLETETGSTTQNGRFFASARLHRETGAPAELVRVYEKVRAGIWVYNGVFRLTDGWAENVDGRRVFKFRLDITEADMPVTVGESELAPDQNRLIPTPIKITVWNRDRGKCVQCGASDNLHFDHVIPYSRGGSSLVAENIQLLCARHNLAKRDRIE